MTRLLSYYGDDFTGSTDVGKKIAGLNGCFSCHSADGKAGTGPTWKDLYGTKGRAMADGAGI